MNHKEIAARIRSQACDFPIAHVYSDEKASFTFEKLTYRCIPTKQAVNALADRIEANKFVNSTGNNAGGIRKVPSFTVFDKSVRPHKNRGFSTVFNGFVKDSEIENAINYAQFCKKPVCFGKGKKEPLIIAHAKEFALGFIVGRTFSKNVPDPWLVTHLYTGYSCGTKDAETAKDAIQQFEKVPEEKLQKAIDKVTDSIDYQQVALTHFMGFL